MIQNKIAHSNIDCIRGNRPPIINLPIYFIMLFFLCEYTGRKNQNMRGQENSTICLNFVQIVEIFSLSPTGATQDAVGDATSHGHLSGSGRYISQAVSDSLALLCQNPVVFRSNTFSLWSYEPYPYSLII